MLNAPLLYLATVGYGLAHFLQEGSYATLYIGYREEEAVPSALMGCVMIEDKIIDVCSLFEVEGESALGDLICGSYPSDMRVYGWNMNREAYELLEYFGRATRWGLPEMVKGHKEDMMKMMEEIEERRNIRGQCN